MNVERVVSADMPIASPRMTAAWKEGTRTRAAELSALNRWIRHARVNSEPKDKARFAVLHDAIDHHVAVAVEATSPTHWRRSFTGARMEAAVSNLDAAEADLLQIAPAPYLLGQMPTVLNNVQRHLKPEDPRRKEIEGIARTMRVNDTSVSRTIKANEHDPRHLVLDAERGKIVSAVRGASSAAQREQTRLRSFRNLVVATTVAMTAVAVTIGIIGWLNPSGLPLCFAPEAAGQTTVVCPTQQVGPIVAPGAIPPADSADQTTTTDIDDHIRDTARPYDITIVELIGLTAAAIAAAGAIRGVRGSSEPYGIPIALALLKLPSGAVTAFLGLLLMRGGFVPGLSALDTSAQILAWAIIFGYSQQLFTRLVDQQAHTVLDAVRGGVKTDR